MKFLKFSFSVLFFLCSLFLFCLCASAAVNSNDALVYDELNIIEDIAVLTGQTQQMRVREYNGTGTGLLVWTSSNPSVISCTPNGIITGIKEGEAKISVKALIGDGKDSITVYCSKRLSRPKTAKINCPFAFSFFAPKSYSFQALHFNLFFLPPYTLATKVDIKGIYGSYFLLSLNGTKNALKGL